MTASLRGLLTPFSVEITPREAAKLPPLSELLVEGTAVYLTYLPNTPWAETVAVAHRVIEAGLRPVPHLAARAVPDRATLQAMLADLAAIGVTDMLLIAGSQATPSGEFHETAQILDSGYLEAAGIRRVGIAGHPEGHPDVEDADPRADGPLTRRPGADDPGGDRLARRLPRPRPRRDRSARPRRHRRLARRGHPAARLSRPCGA